MGNIAVRNLPDEIHTELRAQAKSNGRSLEAEVRSILTAAAQAASGNGFGTRLHSQFANVEGNDLTIPRDQTPSDAGLFE